MRRSSCLSSNRLCLSDSDFCFAMCLALQWIVFCFIILNLYLNHFCCSGPFRELEASFLPFISCRRFHRLGTRYCYWNHFRTRCFDQFTGIENSILLQLSEEETLLRALIWLLWPSVHYSHSPSRLYKTTCPYLSAPRSWNGSLCIILLLAHRMMTPLWMNLWAKTPSTSPPWPSTPFVFISENFNSRSWMNLCFYGTIKEKCVLSTCRHVGLSNHTWKGFCT